MDTENYNNEGEEVILPVKNKGGRPRKTQQQRALEAGDMSKVTEAELNGEMMKRLIAAERVAMSNLNSAFANCQNPHQLVQAMIGLRDLMDGVRGKGSEKSRRVEGALTGLNGKIMDRKAILEIASSPKQPSDIVKILEEKT